MNRPVTLIGIIILVLAAVLFFAKQLTGDSLIIVVVVGVLFSILGLWSGK